MVHLLEHPPLLLQDVSLLADQRPLLAGEQPLQLLHLGLLAPQGLDQRLLALGQTQLEHQGIFRNLVGAWNS